MVTVVATQDLEAGDVLRRFKASQDEPRHGNNIVLVCVRKLSINIDFFLLVCCPFLMCVACVCFST